VGDAGSARGTPCGPKLHDVNSLGDVHRLAFDPMGYVQFSGWVTTSRNLATARAFVKTTTARQNKNRSDTK